MRSKLIVHVTITIHQLLRKFTKPESDDLCRYITKLDQIPPTHTDLSAQLLHTVSSDTDHDEEEDGRYNGPPLSVTLHQCALSDFYLDSCSSKSEAERPGNGMSTQNAIIGLDNNGYIGHTRNDKWSICPLKIFRNGIK